MSKDQLKTLKGGLYAPPDLAGTCTARCTGCPNAHCKGDECKAKDDVGVECGSYKMACYKDGGGCA